MAVKLTYKKSGVDRKAVYSLTKNVSKSWGFAGMFPIKSLVKNYNDPVILSSADGVGTKIWISLEYNRLKGIGQDLVALNVNDVATYGATPLFFLDYYCTHRLKKSDFRQILGDIERSCKECRMKLLGGETAVHPVLSGSNGYHNVDLAGFVVGIADRKTMLTKNNVRQGDVLIGISSSGLHANGFSLIRKAIDEGLINIRDKIRGKTILSLLLEPSHMYSNIVQSLVAKLGDAIRICANITGGSFEKNVPRALPQSLQARIIYGSWRVHPLFEYIMRECNIPLSEMLSTFNMGIGFVVIVAQRDAESAEKVIEQNGFDSYIIGKARKRRVKRGVEIVH